MSTQCYSLSRRSICRTAVAINSRRIASSSFVGGVAAFAAVVAAAVVVLIGVVSAAPPDATILSPSLGDTFQIGQIFHLRGQAFDVSTGEKIDSSYLKWEVRFHENNNNNSDTNIYVRNDPTGDDNDDDGVETVFMEPRIGNNIVMRPAPRPSEPFFVAGGSSSSSDNSNSNSNNITATSSSYLRIILQATDPTTGDVRVVERILPPAFVTFDVGTVPLWSSTNIFYNKFKITTKLLFKTTDDKS
jgi:hypothetical protein